VKERSCQLYLSERWVLCFFLMENCHFHHLILVNCWGFWKWNKKIFCIKGGDSFLKLAKLVDCILLWMPSADFLFDRWLSYKLLSRWYCSWGLLRLNLLEALMIFLIINLFGCRERIQITWLGWLGNSFYVRSCLIAFGREKSTQSDWCFLFVWQGVIEYLSLDISKGLWSPSTTRCPWVPLWHIPSIVVVWAAENKLFTVRLARAIRINSSFLTGMFHRFLLNNWIFPLFIWG